MTAVSEISPTFPPGVGDWGGGHISATVSERSPT